MLTNVRFRFNVKRQMSPGLTGVIANGAPAAGVASATVRER
jgi:hypothetical protein